MIPFEGKPFDKVIVPGKGSGATLRHSLCRMYNRGASLMSATACVYEDKRLLAPEWTIQDELFQKKAYFKFIPFKGGNAYVQLPHGQIANQISWTLATHHTSE